MHGSSSCRSAAWVSSQPLGKYIPCYGNSVWRWVWGLEARRLCWWAETRESWVASVEPIHWFKINQEPHYGLIWNAPVAPSPVSGQQMHHSFTHHNLEKFGAKWVASQQNRQIYCFNFNWLPPSLAQVEFRQIIRCVRIHASPSSAAYWWVQIDSCATSPRT